MTPAAPEAWRGPAWALALLLAALSMIGPFAIDTYLPAFAVMATDLGASPVQMQQTLSTYLFAFAAMNLFHGALSDSLGRRPVVLLGTAVFAVASAGCALAGDIGTLLFFRVLQGASAGAGMTVARAVIRDLYPPSAAQRVMSQVTMFFSLAPALAPLIGGWLLVAGGWRTIFWFLALVTFGFAVAHARWLPESLPPGQRQPLRLKTLLQGYASLLGRRRFVVLVLASSLPFNGYFLYILSAPVFVGELLGVPPTQFFWFFVVGIAGIMAGAWTSGRLAGSIDPARQVALGIAVMGLATLLNLAAAWGSAGATLVPRFAMCTLPLALYAFGWSLIVPVVTIMVLDSAPERRGMAASLQGAIGSTINGLVAGVLAPLVMHSLVGLALASAAQMLLGVLAWHLAQRLR
jgi:DHA1 family bicyclomycin/chloramphenicol resistance-like MFS transporter